MKTKKTKLLVALGFAASMANAQVAWYSEPSTMPPNIFTTTAAHPTNTSIGYGQAFYPYINSNGAYDASGNLKFYVQDLAINYPGGGSVYLPVDVPTYDPYNYHYAWDTPGNEIDIVPVPGGNCNQFYVIYELAPQPSSVDTKIAYVMVDCSSGTPVMTQPSNNILTTGKGGLAVSKMTTANNIRYLFTLDESGVERFTIGTWNSGTSVGINAQTLITPLTTSMIYNSYDITQMELSPDQTRLAWNNSAAYPVAGVYEVSLTSTYGFSSYTTYTIPGTSLIYGLQYTQPTSTTTRLYVSTNLGITYFTPGTSPTYYSLTSTANYGKTQLQLMGNGNVLGVYSTGKLFEINVSANTVALSGNTTTINSNNQANGSKTMYHLPDLIELPTISVTVTNPIAIAGVPVSAVVNYVANFAIDYYYTGIKQTTSTGTPTGNYSWDNGWGPVQPSGSTVSFSGTTSLPCDNYYSMWFAVGSSSACGVGQWATTNPPFVYTSLANAGGPNNIYNIKNCCGPWPGATIGTPAVNGMTYSWAPNIDLSCTNCAQPVSSWQNTATCETYTLTVSASGCTTATSTVNVCAVSPVSCCRLAAGIENQNQAWSSFVVYPNPSNGETTISLPEKADFIQLIDMQGRLIYEAKNIDAGELKLDISKYNKGVYFMRAKIGDTIEKQKLIVE
jgi:hypothetical protein